MKFIFKFSFLTGLFFLLLSFISLITLHPSFTVRLTTFSYDFFAIGMCLYIAILKNEKYK